MLSAYLLLATVASPTVERATPEQVLVTAITRDEAQAEAALVLTNLVTERIDELPSLSAVSEGELGRLMELEGERQAAGCEMSNASCLAELAGALGTRYVVFGQLSRLGDSTVLQLGLFDSEEATAVNRQTIRGATVGSVADQLPAAVDALFGIEAQPRSVVLPVTLGAVGAGVALLGAGTLAGGMAIAADKANPDIGLRQAGQTAALVGIAAMAVGLATLITGAVWLVVE